MDSTAVYKKRMINCRSLGQKSKLWRIYTRWTHWKWSYCSSYCDI